MALLLGLDIGTTSTIGIVIDDQGVTLAVESRPVTFHSDRANWAEEDPEEWWRNVGDICRVLVARIGDAGSIAAIGVTGMLPAIILLDGHGRLLRRSIQQNDARATAELEHYRDTMEESSFLGLTGTGYSQQLVGPKLMWLRVPRAGPVCAGEACPGCFGLHHLSPVGRPAGRTQLGLGIGVREHCERRL